MAARTLAGLVGKAELDQACLYPPLTEIRKISLAIATNVAKQAYAMRRARRKRPRNLRKAIADLMYEP